MGHSLRNAPRLVQVESWTLGSDEVQESLGRFVPKIYRHKLLDSCAVGTSAGVEAYSVAVDISSHQQEPRIAPFRSFLRTSPRSRSAKMPPQQFSSLKSHVTAKSNGTDIPFGLAMGAKEGVAGKKDAIQSKYNKQMSRGSGTWWATHLELEGIRSPRHHVSPREQSRC
jgi:hypothetical protein